MTLQSSSTSHCRTRLLAQQHNTIVFISVPISIGTHSSTVSRTMTTCIPVLSPIYVLCSRCSSLLSFDKKCLTAIRVHSSVLYVLLRVPTPVNISLTISIRASYFCLRKGFLSGGYVVAVIFELLVAKRTIALTEVTRVKRAR